MRGPGLFAHAPRNETGVETTENSSKLAINDRRVFDTCMEEILFPSRLREQRFWIFEQLDDGVEEACAFCAVDNAVVA